MNGLAPCAKEAGCRGSPSVRKVNTDPFGAAHASTSVSAALGFAVSCELQRRKNRVVAVIGDGALSGGMAYEALNNAGSTETPLIVILNDNAMSIAPPVGAMSSYLSRLMSSAQYRSLRDLALVGVDGQTHAGAFDIAYLGCLPGFVLMAALACTRR